MPDTTTSSPVPAPSDAPTPEPLSDVLRRVGLYMGRYTPKTGTVAVGILAPPSDRARMLAEVCTPDAFVDAFGTIVDHVTVEDAGRLTQCGFGALLHDLNLARCFVRVLSRGEAEP